MNTLRATLTTFVLAALGTALTAQKDVIEWHDGTSTKGAKVLEYTAREIKFRAGGSNQTRGAHEVKKVTIEQWNEVLNRHGDDVEALVGEAQGQKNKFIAQAAYFKAASIHRDMGQTTDEFAVLRAILEKIPTSAYAPEFFRRRIQFYISQQKPKLKDAAAAAQKYGAACRQNVWSKAYQIDAELWAARVKALTDKNIDGFIVTLKDIVGRAAIAPQIQTDAQADLADAFRTKKEYENARNAYNSLLDSKGSSVDVIARCYIGLGYIHLEDAVQAKGDKAKADEANRDAYRSFLKVYVICQDANRNIVAEALYNAAKACEAWNGMPLCKKMAGVLRGRLKLRARYKDTYWAKKR